MTQTSFLDKLANYIVNEKQYSFSDIVIVLPNKRAKIFLLESFKTYLKDYFFAPKIVSVEDFVQEISGVRSIDNIELLFEFFEVYSSLTISDRRQDFEQFANWAKILLQDFNEIDRYLINPDYVFSYLKDIEVLKRWDLSPNDTTEIIDKQFEFWDSLPKYYEAFYNHLLKKKIGYQGLIYREAVKNVEIFSSKIKESKVVFAGFNALNQAEERIIQYLISQNKAEILWDIDEVFLKDLHHDAGLFARRFKEQWNYYNTNQFQWIVNEFSKEKNIEIIGTSKSIGQAKIVSQIIQEKSGDTSLDNLSKVALVIGDENLLIPVLHSLPENVRSLNITMGYSSKNNPVQILVAKLFKLHSHALKRNPESYLFYYKDVLELLSNPIIEPYVDASDLINLIKRNNYTFITHNRVTNLKEDSNSFFNIIFKKWNEKPLDILQNIKELLLLIKDELNHQKEEDKLVKTFLYSIFKTINQLLSFCSKNSYVNSVEILQSLYKQVIDLSEVSFEGEPLLGLQVMGVLESRVLDFETVIITSMNEGKFPSGKSNNSFIPYDIKREIGLPTFKEKDAIYSYHFYHLLLRAKNIYLLYNTENEGLDGGEKSRFITQLEVEKRNSHNLSHRIIQPFIPNIAYQSMEIGKTELVLQRLKQIATDKGFSPSALTTYIRNPIQFYFQRVLSIREVDEVEENIALNTLGTIIHGALEELYKPYLNQFLSVGIIDEIISLSNSEIEKQFKEVYKEGEIKKGKNLLAFEVAKRNIYNFLSEEKKLIEKGDTVKIIALEVGLERNLEDARLPFPVKIAGNVDRIEIRNGKLRIIDYKTGKVEPRSLQLKEWNGLTADLKNDKIIQLLCYAFMFEEQTKGLDLEVGIVSFKNMKSGFMPFGIKEGKEVGSLVTSQTLEDFKNELIELILEILNPEIDFKENT